jgi:hypothetical protein
LKIRLKNYYNQIARKNHGHNIQDHWDMIKRTDLCVCGVEKKTDIQTKGIDNVLNKTTVENVHFPNLGEKMDSKNMSHLECQMDMTRGNISMSY